MGESYSESTIRRAEMLCSCVYTESFRVLEFVLTLTKYCKHGSPICNHGFIFWVLKRTVSLRQYFSVPTTYDLVENI